MMKKLFSMFILLFLFNFSVFGATYYDDQTILLNEINNLDIASQLSPDVLIGNASSMGYNLILETEPVYFALYSQTGTDETLNFAYNTGIGSIVKSINVSATSVYYIKFTPQVVGDNVQITLANPSGQISYSILTFNDNERGFSSVTDTFISSITTLIDINMGFWKMLYYLFIFAIILGTLSLLVWSSFKFYEWTDKTRKKKEDIMTNRGR